MKVVVHLVVSIELWICPVRPGLAVGYGVTVTTYNVLFWHGIRASKDADTSATASGCPAVSYPTQSKPASGPTRLSAAGGISLSATGCSTTSTDQSGEGDCDMWGK